MARLERLGVALVAAAYPSVLGVGAIDRRGERYARGNRGLSVKLLAPGVEIVSTAPHSSFAFGSGTSLAAAHVSGVLALLVGAGLSPAEARGLLAPDGAKQPPSLTAVCALLARSGKSCP